MYTAARSYVTAGIVLAGSGIVAVDHPTPPPKVETPVAATAAITTEVAAITKSLAATIESPAAQTAAVSPVGDLATLVAAFRQAEVDFEQSVFDAVDTLGPSNISSVVRNVELGFLGAINDLVGGIGTVVPFAAPVLNALQGPAEFVLDTASTLIGRLGDALSPIINPFINLASPLVNPVERLLPAVQNGISFLGGIVANLLGGTTFGPATPAATTPAATTLKTLKTLNSLKKSAITSNSTPAPKTLSSSTQGPQTAADPAQLPVTSKLTTVSTSTSPVVSIKKSSTKPSKHHGSRSG